MFMQSGDRMVKLELLQHQKNMKILFLRCIILQNKYSSVNCGNINTINLVIWQHFSAEQRYYNALTFFCA